MVAEKTFADFRFDLSEAINLFLHRAIAARGFPFEVHSPEKDGELWMAIQETEQILAEYDTDQRDTRPFASAIEMFHAMDIEDAKEGLK